jgi:methionyl-tRNA synthetase
VPRFYVTTPIYYVNDVPHLGHAYTTVAADTVARWRRLRGDDVMFLTGTDEHGQKVQRAAEKLGRTPQEHADATHVRFKQLWERLDVAHDHFIRTTDSAHQAFVQAQLQSLHGKGLLYTQDYAGWYSTQAERFWAEDELVDGRCPDTGGAVEWVTEKNWFFKMSQFQDALLAHIAANPDCIQPELRRNEVLGYLKKPLGDLCISRPKARLPWGIPLPFDPEYVTYVWFDALTNYLSALHGGREAYWPADYHLIGKDILTFHTVYWYSMLLAMGYPLPKHVYAHGWWLVEGQKMSKSLGNVVSPHLLVDSYGADAVRYFLLREIPFGGDGDFAHQAFLIRYNADLANDLGNLAHRVLATMVQRWCGGVVPEPGPATDNDRALAALAERACATFDAQLSTLQFRQALEALWELVRATNKYVDTEEPWALNKRGDTARLGAVLRNVMEVCRIAASHLACVMPRKSAELLAKVGLSAPDLAPTFDRLVTGAPVSAGDPLFPRLQELPPAIAEALATAKAALAAEAAANPPEKKGKKNDSKKTEAKTPEPAVSTEPAAAPALIEFDDFAKVALRVGLVVSAERHPNAERLLVLKVDVGEAEPRQILAGIAAHYAPEALVGRKIVVVVNLKPRKMRGLESHGMVLAAGESAALLSPIADVAPGTAIS